MYVNKIQTQITDKIIIETKKTHKNPNETDDLAPLHFFEKLNINHNQRLASDATGRGDTI